MLLFIIVKRMIGLHHFEFQYISCYCLSGSVRIHRSLMVISIHLMLLFIGDFVWHRTAAVEFQYISCYCLSISISLKSYQLTLFQYISCYCLSDLGIMTGQAEANFNTSHVTVYQRAGDSTVCTSKISIHLMLLFILCS